MLAQGEDYAYIGRLYAALEPIFDAYSFDLLDFSDIVSVGSGDVEMIDGFHGSEVAYLRLTLKMAARSAALDRNVDSGSLEQILVSVHSGLEVSPDRP